MNIKTCLRSAVVTLVLCSCSATANSDQEKWFSFSFDNDIFVGSDGGYTNGLYFSWYELPKSTDQVPKTQPWYYRVQRYLTHAGDSGLEALTWSFGQTMITPSDIQRTPPDERDTPYAGLLLWQGTVLFVRDDFTEFSTLFLGAVGPISLAEHSQKLVHSITGSDEPMGWNYQLRNEPLLGLRYGRFWQNAHKYAHGREFDIVTGVQGGFGNFISSVEAAAYYRIGSNLQSSYSVLALASNREINPIAHSGGWFAYIGASVQYALNNVLLDGNTFRASPSVDWSPAQNLFALGVATSGKNWGLSLNYASFGGFNTSNDKVGRQSFGSVTVIRKLN